MTNSPKQIGNEVYNLVLRGRVSYGAYLSNGKSYLYAKILRKNNAALEVLLLKYMHLFPKELTAASLELIHHIDVWSTLWDELEQRLLPASEDEFIFQNKVNYPKNFDALLEDYIDRAES